MAEVAQLKAEIPRDLKRRAFAAFAMRDEKFARWLRAKLETWLEEVEQSDEEMAVTEIDSE